MKDAQKVAYRDEPANASGEFKRVSLWRTNMKYPLLRVEEVIIREGPLNEEIVISQQASVADHIVIKIQPGVSDQDFNKMVNGQGATILRKIAGTDLYIVHLPNAHLDTLPQAVASFSAKKDLLQYAESDPVVSTQLTANDPNYSQEWGLHNTGQTGGKVGADIDAPNAWSVTTGSSAITVAVIDTGVDSTHPDLATNIDTVNGWNFYNDNNNPADDNFHGTHVSGTIGAVGNNSVGVTGVAWKVKILPLKFLSANGSGYLSDAIAAIQYGISKRVNIMSNSWGGGGYSQALKDTIDAAAQANILFVAAAGNDSNNNDLQPTYPAAYACSNIIAVAATDANDQLASFSNYGATTVQISAPGVGILSTFPVVTTTAMQSRGLSASYGRISGTSMATPHVTGAAVLALTQNPSLTVSQLRSLLIQRCAHLSNLAGLVQGGNRLNAYNLVNSAWQSAPPQLGLLKFKMDDSEGNNDGYSNPGEIIHVTPTIMNSGGQTASGVTLQLVSQQATATILTLSNITAGDSNPYQPLTPLIPFRIQLSTALTDNAVLNFDLLIIQKDGTTTHAPFTIAVTKPQPKAEVTLNFACGEMKADPVRNLVYLINKTDHRVLAIDTAQGQVSAVGALDGDPTVKAPVENGSLQSGQMAISRDGTKLFVALTSDNKIQVLSLPDLTPLYTLDVDFSPESLAIGVSDRLYASSTDYWGKIREVNSTTGQTVQTFDKGNSQQFYMHALLRTNLDGTSLYVAETGLNVVGGPGYVYQYNITGAQASLSKQHPFSMVYLKDFAIDEPQQRLYTMNGGIYGVQVTDMVSGTYGDVWPLNSAYGVGLAFLSNDSVIYGVSGDPYAGTIRKFQRTDGAVLGDYIVGNNGAAIPSRGIAITPNGALIYIKDQYTGNATQCKVGIVGRASLTVNNPPPTPATAAIKLASIQFSDLEGNGNSIPNSGEIITLTPTLANSGAVSATDVTVQISVGSGGTLLSSATQTLNTITGGTSQTANACRIQLVSGLAAGTTIPVSFTVTWNGTQTKTFTYTVIIQADRTTAEIQSSLQFGEILADQQRNIVYVIDKRNLRLLALNTDTGHVDMAVALARPSSASGTPPTPGAMAESVDGTKLYVALNKSKMIQVFSLPDLTPLAVWSYDFEPCLLTTSSVDSLYCITSDPTQNLVQINSSTGAVLGHIGDWTSSGYGARGELIRNAAGTEIYSTKYASSTITRYTVGANGALSILSNYSSASAAFALDESRSCLYILSSNTTVSVRSLAGVTLASWASGWGSISYLPGSTSVLALSSGSSGAMIRRFSCTSGAVLQDYPINGGDVVPHGLATTPNGRTVYVKNSWIGSSTADSVDGYRYWIGIIGLGSIDLDVPGNVPVVLKNVTLTDPAPGNTDGYANPGETIQLAAVLKNVSAYSLNNITVELLSSNPLAVVQSPSLRTIGNVNSYVSFTPSPNFAVVLNSSLTDGAEIKLTFRVTSSAGTQLIPYSLIISAPVNAETQVPFAIGEMIADRTRNLAYVIDKTNQRLIAIDTEAGNVAKSAKLVGDPGEGRMTISPDGSRLYVAIANANKIQSFNLPALEQADIIDLNFSPIGLAAASDGKLYASSASSGYLWQIDPATGQIIGQFGRRTYYYGSALKLSGDGSRLYIAELGLSSSTAQLDEYLIRTSGMPIYNGWYPYSMANDIDLAVDDTYGRIYVMAGGIYGIGVTDMTTGIGNLIWPFGAPYGVAMCFLPGGNVIYGGCGSTYDYAIYKFDRVSGQRIGRMVAPKPNADLMPRAMVITANGRIIYGKSEWTGSGAGIGGYYYTLGIIGRASLTINSPSLAPTLYLGADQLVRLSNAASLSLSSSSTDNLTTNWTIVNGPKGAFFDAADANNSAAASFSAPGVYRVRATANNGSSHASDEITVTVLPDPASVSVTAPAPIAIQGMAAGQLMFSRTGLSSGALDVAYTVSGTAIPGSDYASLTGTITIPDGYSSTSIQIVPLRVATTDSTVTVQLTTSTNYNLGISQSATVTFKKRSFDSWQAAKLSGQITSNQSASASPSGDGIPNLIKYALQLDPLANATAGLPTTNTATQNGNHYQTLTYKRLQNVSDITYQVEVSNDLLHWDSGTTYTTETSVVPNSDGTETVTAQDKISIGTVPTRFIRLKIVKP